MGGETGLTLLEVVAALSISVVAFASVHLTAGTAILGKLLTSSTVSKDQQGRKVVEWIADRVRQAGFRTAGTSIPRCQDKISTQSGYLPTTSQLWINADIENTGTPQTRGFQIETVSGVPAVTETVINCVTGAATLDQPITSPTTVRALALQFDYYDANGTAVTNLTSPPAIRTIRYVKVTVQVQASAGAHGPSTQTWTTNIDLRNP
jgi:type II secretory pathway component PulJ